MPKITKSPIMAEATTAGLPTPAPSTEIYAKKASISASSLDHTFALPPAAIQSPPTTRKSSIASSSKADTDSSYSPEKASKHKLTPSKRKSSAIKAAAMQRVDYAVPPPPSRSRKIIQMKPRAQQSDKTTYSAKGHPISTSVLDASSSPEIKSSALTTTNPSTGTKRKQAASATTAAGRKMARKTAHSLIERRRRSKMNEEFGVLKDMIPACKGQEMHKLAILQASIEYMNYLEKCISDLKSSHDSPPQHGQRHSKHSTSLSPLHNTTRPSTAQPSTRSSSIAPPPEDAEMPDLPPIREILANQQYSQPQSRLPSISPAIPPMNYSVHGSPLHQAQRYNPPVPQASSTQTSPMFSGERNNQRFGSISLTSPVIPPNDRIEDQEATQALLMLNTDRRSWSEKDRKDSTTTGNVTSTARGMSVRSMLTS